MGAYRAWVGKNPVDRNQSADRREDREKGKEGYASSDRNDAVLADRAVKKPRRFDPRAADFPRSLIPREIWSLCGVAVCGPSVKARNQQRAAKKTGPGAAFCMAPPAVACRRHLPAPAPGHRLAIAGVAFLFSSALCRLPWHRQTQSF